MMSEQRFAEAARAGLSGSEISTLLGRELKEPTAAWFTDVSVVVMHRSNNT
jgi:hypothetical protein